MRFILLEYVNDLVSAHELRSAFLLHSDKLEPINALFRLSGGMKAPQNPAQRGGLRTILVMKKAIRVSFSHKTNLHALFLGSIDAINLQHMPNYYLILWLRHVKDDCNTSLKSQISDTFS